MRRYNDMKLVLAESLRELLVDRQLEDITVKLIVENCGTTTRTFYNHFKDKQDLAYWMYSKELLSLVVYHEEAVVDWEATLCSMLDHMYTDKSLYGKLVVYNGQNSFMDALYEEAVSTYLADISSKLEPSDDLDGLRFVVECFLKGNSTQLREWLLGGCKITPQEFAQKSVLCFPEILKPFFYFDE